ncbi:MAG: CpsD/CapB family tyrosine-protein kinase [Candidatus Omnitrophica bacterium]|nr:CpsD/CapB family tyrosine-protein kinase [Candidatus Omnitrophota bacterium]
MGKLTEALKKAASERLDRVEKISRIKDRKKMIIRKIGDSQVDERVIAYFDPKALITEQYKILRTNVLALNKTHPPKVLVMTSSIHGEGKTITTLNLAVSVAHSTEKPKVLVIDADMRRGRVSRYLGVDQEVGLSEVLSGKAEASDALFNLDIENLAFIAAGSVPENPSELLSSNKMKKLLADMKVEFDHIFIDTPPIISVADAGIVGAQADGALMMIQAGRTQRGIIKRATELLNQTHTKVLGHILTNIEYHLPEYIYRYL